MQIKISPGNVKMGRIPSISLPPVQTCRPDAPCTADCYARKAWRMYPSVREAWQNNLTVYEEDPEIYFEQLHAVISKRNYPWFRFHVAGDFVDQEYFTRTLQLAKGLPGTKFLAFTKRFDYIEQRSSPVPESLSIVLSMWPGLPSPGSDLNHFPRTWVRDPKNPDPRVPETAVPCPGHCDTCNLCWSLKLAGIKDVVFDKH